MPRSENSEQWDMRRILLVIAFIAGLIAPAFAQKAEIEAVNAKWVDFFNKGDFAGVASLYTDDAAAFPPGAGIVRGKDAIGAMWKGLAEQGSDHKSRLTDVAPQYGAYEIVFRFEDRRTVPSSARRAPTTKRVLVQLS